MIKCGYCDYIIPMKETLYLIEYKPCCMKCYHIFFIL